MRLKALEQRDSKPTGWGLTPPPPRKPFDAWQVAQSRSVWHATHALMFRWASQLWWRALRGATVQICGGGWKRRPADRLPLGASRATPTRRWQSAQNVCVWWQLTQRGLSWRAACGCIEMKSLGCTLRGRTRPIMTIATEIRRVAIAAQLAVAAGDPLVTLDPVGGVLGGVQPIGRLQDPAAELGQQAPARLGDVAVGAVALGFTRARRRHRVACKAAGHARQLLARGELQLFDHAVALRAVDVAIEVLLVRKTQVRIGDHHARDLAAFAGVVAEVAEVAGAVVVTARHHLIEVRVIDVVAVVAGLRGDGQERVLAVEAAEGRRMTDFAGLLELFDVLFVVEADRERLRWEDLVARNGARAAAGRHPLQRHHGVVRERIAAAVARALGRGVRVRRRGIGCRLGGRRGGVCRRRCFGRRVWILSQRLDRHGDDDGRQNSDHDEPVREQGRLCAHQKPTCVLTQPMMRMR